jgi:hypothetical protein
MLILQARETVGVVDRESVYGEEVLGYFGEVD